MIDLEFVFRNLLTSLPAITSHFQDRIFFARSTPPSYRVDNGPALLVTVRGGDQDYTSQLFHPSFQMRCYAKTEKEAREACRHTITALNDTQARGMPWIRMEDGTIPVLLNEPSTDWPYMLFYVKAFMQNL